MNFKENPFHAIKELQLKQELDLMALLLELQNSKL